MATNDRLHVVAPPKNIYIPLYSYMAAMASPEFATEFLESQASDDSTLLQLFPSYKWAFPPSE
jgi:hypothetical protein